MCYENFIFWLIMYFGIFVMYYSFNDNQFIIKYENGFNFIVKQKKKFLKVKEEGKKRLFKNKK